MVLKSLISLVWLTLFVCSLYAAEGDVLWTKTVNWGMLPADDKGVAVKLDSAGNIYIAGGEGNSLWLGKFDNSGNPVWKVKLTGISFWQSDGYVRTCDIAIDSDDNIYLTALSYPDIWIRKYDSSGTELWTRTYNHPGAEYSEPRGICVSGTAVYIAGNKINTSFDPDSLLLKYDTSGNFQWARTNNTGDFWEDSGNDVAVDTAGNVYLVGTMNDPVTMGSGLMIAKYDASGKLLKITNAGAAPDTYGNAVSVSPSGDIFISGQQSGDIWTARISSSFALLWEDTYDGTANGWQDNGLDITLDSMTNVLVAGTSEEATFGNNMDIFLRKLTPAGGVTFTELYNHTSNSNDYGYAVATDGSDNIYLVGYVYDSTKKFDIFIRKYNSAGDVQWTKFYNSTRGSDDEARSVAVDNSGNVYVVGSVETTNRGTDIWVAKYNSSGLSLWTRVIDGGIGADDEGVGICVDNNSGYLYVSGTIETNTTRKDIWLRKYDLYGNEQWTRIVDGPSKNYDQAGRVAVDKQGNVYITGAIWVSNQGYNIWIRKYDSSGTEIWTKTYNNSSQDYSYDRGFSIFVDSSSNVYVIGTEQQSGQQGNIWIRKMDSAGNEIWTRTHNGPINGFDQGFAIGVDSLGNVIAGGIEETATGYDIWLRKYDSTGATQWTRTYDSGGGEVLWDLTIDNENNIYITGIEGGGTATGGQIWTRKYDSAGNVLWTWTYNYGPNDDGGEGIALTPQKDIIIAGYVTDTNENVNIWIRKYEGAHPHLTISKLVDTPATNAGGNRFYPALLVRINDSASHNITSLKITNYGSMIAGTDVQYLSLYYYPSGTFIGKANWATNCYKYTGSFLSKTNILIGVVTSADGITGRTFQAGIKPGWIRCSAGYTNTESVTNANAITRIKEVTVTKLKDMPAANVGASSNNISVLAFKITDVFNDNIKIIRLSNLGTMEAGNDIASVKLWVDKDLSTNYSPGDILAGTGIWNPINYTYDFTNLTIPSGTNIIATIDTAESIRNGRTFKGAILAYNARCNMGVGSEDAITNANFITASVPHTVGAVKTNVSYNPPTYTVSKSKTNVPVMGFRYYCSDGDSLKVLRITNIGVPQMQPGTDITKMRLYIDRGVLGVYEPGIDIFRALLNYDSSIGKWTNNNLSIGAGTNIIITIDTADSLNDSRIFKGATSATQDIQCSNGKSSTKCITNLYPIIADTNPPSFAGLDSIQVTSKGDVILNWTLATDNWTPKTNLIYRIYQATFSGGQNFNSPNWTVKNKNSFIISDLPAGDYYYVVRCIDMAGNEDANLKELHIKVVRVASDLENVYIYPNPVYGCDKFYITELTKEAKIRIYNIRGNLVKEILKISDEKRQELSPCDLGLASGVYLIYIDNKDGQKSKIIKLVYVK